MQMRALSCRFNSADVAHNGALDHRSVSVSVQFPIKKMRCERHCAAATLTLGAYKKIPHAILHLIETYGLRGEVEPSQLVVVKGRQSKAGLTATSGNRSTGERFVLETDLRPYFKAS
jgi:hypothetical protein